MEETNSTNDLQQPVVPLQPVEKPQLPPEKEVKQPLSPDASQAEDGQNITAQKSPRKKITLIILIIVFVVLAIIAIACLVSLAYNRTIEEESIPEPTANSEPVSLDDFDFRFLRLEDNGNNIIYSPLSIKYALAMLSDAAAGESKVQIENLIGEIELKPYTNNEKRSLANAMFVKDEVKDQILESYTQTLKQKYDASLIADPFVSAKPFNDWVSSKTFGLIDDLFDESVLESDFILLNALAIDMNWNNRLQCSEAESEVPCMTYESRFTHEDYQDSVKFVVTSDNFDEISFNGQEEVPIADIGASANNYDIASELGEEYIRSTVQSAYDEWLAETQESKDYQEYPEDYDLDFDIDKYMEELKGNYGKVGSSTDFYFLDTDSEEVFAKDLQENDGSTLQYIGIMPKNSNLNQYINDVTDEKIANIANSLNDVSTIDGFKKGVITKVSVNVPFFNFNYKLKLLDDLKNLGITDVFLQNKADLSQMTTLPGSYIQDALHKADIDFSNDGIRAAATTALDGGLGAGGKNKFEYDWKVPIEEINLIFNQPFMFVIRDKNTGEIWFTGAVYNPAS